MIFYLDYKCVLKYKNEEFICKKKVRTLFSPWDIDGICKQVHSLDFLFVMICSIKNNYYFKSSEQ